jgi:hypothetical protein
MQFETTTERQIVGYIMTNNIHNIHVHFWSLSSPGQV